MRTLKTLGLLFVYLCATIIVIMLTLRHANGDDYPLRIPALGIVAAIAFVSYFIAISSGRRHGIPFRRISPMLGYIGLLLLFIPSSFLNVALPADTLSGLANQILILSMILATYVGIALAFQATQEQFVDRCAEFAVFLGLFSVAIGVHNMLNGSSLFGPFSIRHERWLRIYGWYGNPNVLGMVLAVSTVSSVYLALARGRRFIYVIISILLSVGILMTGSRGALLAVVGGSLPLVYLHVLQSPPHTWSRRALARTASIGSIVLLIGTAAMLFLKTFGIGINDYLEFTARLENIDSGSGRFVIWSSAARLLESASVPQLLFGLGHQAVVLAVDSSTHNDYLRLLTSFGLVFGVYFVLFIAWLFWVLLRLYFVEKNTPLLWSLGIAVCCLTIALTNDGLLTVTMTGFTFNAALVAMSLRS